MITATAMPMPSRSVTLRERDLAGSRLRCLLLTHQPAEATVRVLTALAEPVATVRAEDFWMPRGPLAPAEAKLGDAAGLLSAVVRDALTRWWLAVPTRANTPNWDLASTCMVAGRPGLLLVEAKAHAAELSSAGKPAGNEANDRSIRAAIQQASAGLNGVLPGWSLTAESHYQLANRFAWAWKLASLGVPVVLVYLGCLHAEDMARRGEPFRSAEQWDAEVRRHAQGIVPAGAWGRALDIGGVPLYALIRALESHWHVSARE
jgi:hypothetical protein